ncbi:hypothetical protein PHLCEN_2v6026 [Hermanssonia centrifuga]|uniref:Deacetylase sirtuin-type domain-containing protein n=1 Tax=Hermanssonia centrifuga TaxID=98765 RepID=A0A2R6P0Q4_9APHY|nr:hypothetical protein PHLCEN_2v6026 [Hermanssonia centrifuga]
MDPHPPTGIKPPTPTDAGSESRARAPSQMYALQVRAFIEASEVVDIDPDTIEDILDGFNGDIHVEGDSDDEEDMPDAFAEGNAGAQAQVEQEEDEEDEEFNILLEEAEIAWSDEETKLMMSDLKENGMSRFVNKYVVIKAIPIPKLLNAFGICLCTELRNKCRKTLMYFLQVAISRELRSREKLSMYNTIDDAVDLIRKANHILILTGAGISVSCGIPDFRSRNGLYSMLQQKGEYELDDPQQMFDINYFRENPSIPGNAIESDIMQQKIPLCAVCAVKPVVLNVKVKKKGTKKKKKASPWEDDSEEEPDIPAYPPGIMKPDITFFGEKLTDDFDKALLEDRPQVDLLLVIGTSLKVSPVSEILTHLRHSVPQILINKTPVKHINPDIVLLGNADDIVQHLSRKLDWELPTGAVTPPAATVPGRSGLRKRPSSRFEIEPLRVGDSHVWLFEGAEGGKWVDDIEKRSRAVKLPSTPLPSKPGTPRPAENDVESARLAKKARTT